VPPEALPAPSVIRGMSGLFRPARNLLGRERARQRKPASGGGGKRTDLRAVPYHHITEHVSSLVDRLAISAAPAVFEAHLRKMARDYEVVGLDAVLSGNLPRRALLITFDDGYRSFIEGALPTLRRLGLPSVLFVTGACLDPYSVPLDNLLSYLCATLGLARMGNAVDPAAARPATFLQLLDIVASMPYEQRLSVGEELAERFEVDQARLRAEGASSSTRRTSADWRRKDVRLRTTLALMRYGSSSSATTP
jgi:hypothetical protein